MGKGGAFQHLMPFDCHISHVDSVKLLKIRNIAMMYILKDQHLCTKEMHIDLQLITLADRKHFPTIAQVYN